MTQYQYSRVRVGQDVGANQHKNYAVDIDLKKVYEAKGGEIREENVVTDPKLRGAIFDAVDTIRWDYPRMPPGNRPDRSSPFKSGGMINAREWGRFRAGESIPAERSPRSLHVDYFDRRGTGYITIPDMAAGWPVVGASPIIGPVKAVATAIVFGSKNPFSGHFLEVATDDMPRPKGTSGLFLPDSKVNWELANKVLAHLEPKEVPEGRRPPETNGKTTATTWLSENEFMKVLLAEAGKTGLGSVPKKQYSTLFDATARLNSKGERRINKEQFLWFLEGSLNDYVASKSDSSGVARGPKFYRKMYEENEALKAGLDIGLAKAPKRVLENHLEVLRPEVLRGR